MNDTLLRTDAERILQQSGFRTRPFDAERFLTDVDVEPGSPAARTRPALLNISVVAVRTQARNCAASVLTQLRVPRHWVSGAGDIGLQIFFEGGPDPERIETVERSFRALSVVFDTLSTAPLLATEQHQLIVATEYLDLVRSAVHEDVTAIALALEGNR